MKEGGGDMKRLAPTDRRGIETTKLAGAIDATMKKTDTLVKAITNDQSAATGTTTAAGASAVEPGPMRGQSGPRDVEEVVGGAVHLRARIPGPKNEARNIAGRN